MPDYNEIFSGIPSLDDEAGVQNYLNNATLSDAGLGNVETPAALQTQEQTPAAEPQDTTAQAAPHYTADQVAAIIARNQQLESQMVQQNNVRQMTAQRQTAAQPAYTPRQAELIKQLIDKGVPLERISAAIAGRAQASQAQADVMNRISKVEQYLQAQEYAAAQNAFVDKMTTFGNKYGLSENDLVTFGNKAMSIGINLTEVPSDAIENVFKAVYPDQYAIRSQRMAGSAASHIYGGSSTIEPTRASASKLEDAYVDAFLKQSMPNQYGKYTK